jgi:hypothetical protein
MTEDGHRFFDVRLNPDLAVAMRVWDDKLFAMRQVWMQSAHMIRPLLDANMRMCAKQAQRIHDDLRTQIATGELFIRMLRQHAEEHPVIGDGMSAEMFRQYNNVITQYYFWSTEGDERTDLLSSMLDEYQQLITAAVQKSADDCNCDPSEEEGEDNA